MKREITMSARQTPAAREPLLDVADGPAVASDNFRELAGGDVPDPGGAVPRMVSCRTWSAPRLIPSAFTRFPNMAAGSKVAMTLVESRSRTG
jgi:hypothetical protein